MKPEKKPARRAPAKESKSKPVVVKRPSKVVSRKKAAVTVRATPSPKAAPARAKADTQRKSKRVTSVETSPDPGIRSVISAQLPAEASFPEKSPSSKAHLETSSPLTKVEPPKAKEPKRFDIPPILMEGDLPPTPKVTGPGARYALGPGPLGSQPVTPEKELPEGYGTRRLFLAARDPRWLYASWDLTTEQQREYNRRSRDGHLILRVYLNDESTPVVPEVHVNPESRTWFVNVPRTESRYRAELGFYSKSRNWESVSTSQSTFTPPEAPSTEGSVEFATIPAQVTFEQVVQTVQEFVTEHRPLLEAVVAAQEAQRAEEVQPDQANHVNQRHHAGPPHSESVSLVREDRLRPFENELSSLDQKKVPVKAPKREIPIKIERAEPWAPERKEALAQLITIDTQRRVWMGSIEITELVRRYLQEEVSSIAAAELTRAAAETQPGAPVPLGISSPPGGDVRKERNFWFKVNAELIIYGATDPSARVTIADRPVKLRPDGSFSFRFALPDGRYELPALAVAPDGLEGRVATLEFSRSTEYQGYVEPHPQDATLRPPRPENL